MGWPFITSSEMECMLTKLCIFELERYRQYTPPVSSKGLMKQYDRIFQDMDWRGRGNLIPADIAGGEFQDRNSLQKQLIDEHTVKAILGDRAIDWPEFLELMCEDDCRGHEDSDHAIMKDGRHLVLHVRESVGFQGWVLRDVPPEEVSIRRRADALEAEALRWRHAVRAELEEEDDFDIISPKGISRPSKAPAMEFTRSASLGRSNSNRKRSAPTDHDFAVDHLFASGTNWH